MSVVTRTVDPDPPLHFSTYSPEAGSWVGRLGAAPATAPTSGTYVGANVIMYTPFNLWKPYSLARWWWLNGATVGTNYIQTGIYDQDLNLVKSSPKTLSAGTVNQVQYANPGISGYTLTSNNSNTDAATYTTASVTLKAGTLYLMAVENSKGTTADAVSAITATGGGGPTWTSRSTTTFNTSNVNRVSIWSAVPTSDITDTFVIAFGGNTQTGACWALSGFQNVDTATTDGIVQNATGTGNSTTPLATLAAFGSANNATYGAFGVGAANAGTPSTGYFELADQTTAAPAAALQCTYRPDNDTTVDETITSAQWGAAAVEIKSLGTSAITIPAMRGYLAIWCNGTTATLFRVAVQAMMLAGGMYDQASQTTGLPQAATLDSAVGSNTAYVYGFTSRSSP